MTEDETVKVRNAKAREILALLKGMEGWDAVHSVCMVLGAIVGRRFTQLQSNIEKAEFMKAVMNSLLFSVNDMLPEEDKFNLELEAFPIAEADSDKRLIQ
jgi:hypothetical protein